MSSLLCVSSRSVCVHRYCSTCALFDSKSALSSLSAPLSASIFFLAAFADAVPARVRARAGGKTHFDHVCKGGANDGKCAATARRAAALPPPEAATRLCATDHTPPYP